MERFSGAAEPYNVAIGSSSTICVAAVPKPLKPVRVEKRRGSELYINDGANGALFDAAHIGWRYPVRLLREGESNVRPMEFSFYGPTCDDLDHMAGPFELPGDVGPGDYIEVGMLGAYGCAMRTGFNGFGTAATHIVEDEPMATLYGSTAPEKRSHVVTL